jgi:putative spermidine/putrescine transport system ATP-binding protein
MSASAARLTHAHLDVKAVSKSYGETTVLDRLDLAVERGEFISLLGPSGCGKTTLLRLIAGLQTADSGSISVDGREMTSLPAHKRNIGVVFQNYALFPHLTVAENVAFGLDAKGTPKAEIAGIVDRTLRLVKLEDMAPRTIFALSGGQQQRVAVARALAIRPSLLLLDEPFSALDRKLRETMQIDLRRLLRELAITAVFVTHDQEEAMVMSDRIAVMNRGAIEQLAEPKTIYDRPATAFALEFVGGSSRLPATVAGVDGDYVRLDTGLGPIVGKGHFLRGVNVLAGVRPEKIAIGRPHDPRRNALAARVIDRVFLGSKLMVIFDAGEGGQGVAELNAADMPDLPADGVAEFSWAIDDTLVFPAEGNG